MPEVLKATPAEMVPVKEEHVPAEGMLRIFKCRRAHVQYVFRDGSLAVFRPRTNEAAGHFLTDDPAKIAEMEEVIKGHPHMYKDPEEFEVAAKLADPSVAAAAKIADSAKAELMAMLQSPELLKQAGINPEAMKKLLDAGRDFGDTAAKPALQGISNSNTIGALSAQSDGGAPAAPTASATKA